MYWKYKFLLSFLLLFFLKVNTLLAQSNQNSKTERLTKQQIKAFERTAIDMFDELENLTLIIMDENEEISDRREAIYLARLFFAYKASIQDDLGTGVDYVDVLSKDIYFERVYELANIKNEFSKDFTLIKVDSFKPKVITIDLDNHGKASQVYEAELTYIDFTAITDIVPEVQLSPENTYTRKTEQYKKMVLEIRKIAIPREKWQLFIKDIVVLEKKDKAYKTVKKNVKESSSLPTSQRLTKPLTVDEITTGIMEDTLVAYVDDKEALDSIFKDFDNDPLVDTDYKEYLGLNMFDFVIPGRGHLKFNKNKNSVIPTVVYATLATGAVASAVYFKLESNRYYDAHLKDTRLVELDRNFDRAEELNRYYNYSLAAAALIWTLNGADLLRKNNKYKPVNNISVSLQAPSDTPVGLGLVVNF